MGRNLVAWWVYGGFLAALALLCLTPLLVSGWPPWRVAGFLLLPAYMIHQFEEHHDDRFRRFFNEVLGKGREVLSPRAVFVTNVPVVWGTMIASMYLCADVAPGWALPAIDLVLVNALVHVLCALVLRRYNPGLVTALVLFAPLGTVALWLVCRLDGAPAWHVLGLTFAVGVHALILGNVRRNLHRLDSPVVRV